MTLRPLGPSVTRTAWVSVSMPRSILSRASTENFTCLADMSVTPQKLLRSPARSASGPRIFGAIVQPAYSVAAESLPIDLQAGPEKKFGWKFLDRETDGIRGASKSSVPDGLPASPPPGGKNLRLAPGRGQLGLGAVIKKREHVLGPVGQANDVMNGMDLKAPRPPKSGLD